MLLSTAFMTASFNVINAADFDAADLKVSGLSEAQEAFKDAVKAFVALKENKNTFEFALDDAYIATLQTNIDDVLSNNDALQGIYESSDSVFHGLTQIFASGTDVPAAIGHRLFKIRTLVGKSVEHKEVLEEQVGIILKILKPIDIAPAVRAVDEEAFNEGRVAAQHVVEMIKNLATNLGIKIPESPGAKQREILESILGHTIEGMHALKLLGQEPQFLSSASASQGDTQASAPLTAAPLTALRPIHPTAKTKVELLWSAVEAAAQRYARLPEDASDEERFKATTDERRARIAHLTEIVCLGKADTTKPDTTPVAKALLNLNTAELEALHVEQEWALSTHNVYSIEEKLKAADTSSAPKTSDTPDTPEIKSLKAALEAAQAKHAAAEEERQKARQKVDAASAELTLLQVK